MHTEHLQNVRPAMVLLGWLIAFAVAALLALALASFGIALDATADTAADVIWGLLCVAVGFFVGGFAVGFRTLHAPILHGIGIGVTSLVAWLALNVVVRGLFPEMTWEALTPTLTAALLLEQMLAAVTGAWFGYALALRGEPEPED